MVTTRKIFESRSESLRKTVVKPLEYVTEQTLSKSGKVRWQSFRNVVGKFSEDRI